MFGRFNEGINAQACSAYETKPEFMFRTDIFTAYHNDETVRYGEAKDSALGVHLKARLCSNLLPDVTPLSTNNQGESDQAQQANIEDERAKLIR